MKRGIRNWGLGIGSVRQRWRPERAGYALVLFVMMFFGLMGLAALIIDMGFARLAQRQMQTAVDSASLEGLRWRDASLTAHPPNPRQQASQIVASLFTDYVDSSGGTVHYGAGPVVNFSGGIGPAELAASQLMQPGTPPVLPARKAGVKHPTTPRRATWWREPIPGQPGVEGDDYTRTDFTPAPSGSSTGNAFLVRMRDAPIILVGSTRSPASVPAVRRCPYCSAAAA